MAQHGDLQVPITEAHAAEHPENPAQDPIQEEHQHQRNLTGSWHRCNAACQRADRICLPHRVHAPKLMPCRDR